MSVRASAASVIALGAISLILPVSHALAQSTKSSPPAGTRQVTVGAFSIAVPNTYRSFNTSEATVLRRQYLTQSAEIYQQFSGSVDQARTVDLAAFHVAGDAGTFAIVSFTVPAQAELISLLKTQVPEKMSWGVRQGHIRRYLGLVSIDNSEFSGFYTKAIGTNGVIEISGGLEHKRLKNTIIQLTLICPNGWDEATATDVLSSIIKSVVLRDR